MFFDESIDSNPNTISLKTDLDMAISGLRKQISIFISLDDWKTIRLEAARLKIPMAELCRRWMRPDLTRLKKDYVTSIRIQNRVTGKANRQKSLS